MNLLFTADNHFRYSQPICRKDDYVKTQKKKIRFINKTADQYDATIINAGDVVDKDIIMSQSEIVMTISFLIKNLKKQYGIAGNHDLLYRDFDNVHRSLIQLLIASEKYVLIDKLTLGNADIYGFNYGTSIEHKEKTNERMIAVYHGMVLPKENKIIKGKIAIDLLKEFPEYDVILTGDNHTTFVEEYENRFLINPGSLLRMDADQTYHNPCIFIYNTETHYYEKIYIPIGDDVISREHIDSAVEREDRLYSFIEKFDNDFTVTLDFIQSMDNYIQENKIETNVIKEIYEALEKTV